MDYNTLPATHMAAPMPLPLPSLSCTPGATPTFVTVQATMSDGTLYTSYAAPGFSLVAQINPGMMTIPERRNLVGELSARGWVQREIARFLDISQPTVSRDLRLLVSAA